MVTLEVAAGASEGAWLGFRLTLSSVSAREAS